MSFTNTFLWSVISLAFYCTSFLISGLLGIFEIFRLKKWYQLQKDDISSKTNVMLILSIFTIFTFSLVNLSGISTRYSAIITNSYTLCFYSILLATSSYTTSKSFDFHWCKVLFFKLWFIYIYIALMRIVFVLRIETSFKDSIYSVKLLI